MGTETRSNTRVRWILKGCPRCGGDVLVEIGEPELCIACGNRRDSIEPLPPLERKVGRPDKVL